MSDTSHISTPALRRARFLLFIPIYNCAPQIHRVIAQLTPEVRAVIDEVVVVNNRSTDDSQQAAIDSLMRFDIPRAKVLLNDRNYGLGGSHKVAFDYALKYGFDYVIVLHGDDQASIADLMPLLAVREYERVECLLGSRFMKGARLSGYSRSRTLGNRLFNGLYSLAAGVRIHDLGSGLNLYSVTSLSDRVYLSYADDLTFNYYMILGSIAVGHRIQFFPIEWRELDQVSNVKLVRQSLRVLSIVVRYAALKGRFVKSSDSGERRSYGYSVVFDSEDRRSTT